MKVAWMTLEDPDQMTIINMIQIIMPSYVHHAMICFFLCIISVICGRDTFTAWVLVLPQSRV